MPDKHFKPPEVIGPYREVRLIATGGMGFICKAVDSRLDRPVALKWLIGRQEVGAENVLRREARLAARLKHPGLVRIYGLEEHDGIHMVVMEWVEGQSLQRLIAEGQRWTPGQAARTLALVAEAVGHAHASGIVHCDIKPANIIIGRDGKPTVLDFGIAVDLTDPSGARGPLSGTAAYMAPEQVASQRPAPSADVFSLGAVAWEMIIGEPAFGEVGEDDSTLLDEIVRRPAPDLTEVEDELGAMAPIVRRALSPKPKTRPQNGQALAAELRRVATAVGETSTGGQKPSSNRRRPKRAGATLAPRPRTGNRLEARRGRRPILMLTAGVLVFLSVGAMAASLNRSNLMLTLNGGGGGAPDGAGSSRPLELFSTPDEPVPAVYAQIRVSPPDVPYILGYPETGTVLVRGPNSESSVLLHQNRGTAATLRAPGYVPQDRVLQPGLNEFILVPDSVRLEITTNRDAFAQLWREGDRESPVSELPAAAGRAIAFTIPSGTYWLAISPDRGQCLWRQLELDRAERERDSRIAEPGRQRISILIPEPSAGVPSFSACGPPRAN